ncbi:uncharacterized protein [Nicotiana sylvestris]|uniref:uncharacterized protein n=1 Tax=Nicotiana sylvestris TaxID=4096 RepID=UPI00388CBDE1
MTIDNGNPSATVGATTITSSSCTAVPPAEKPGRFSRTNFKGWQQRVFFWFTTLGMQKFTSEEPPVPAADTPDNEKFMVVEAWKQVDFLCKGYILSALEDDLYNVYIAMNTSKELWDALEKKYKTEDACLKKFVVSKFLDYKMIDNKTMGTQVQELQLIFYDLIAEGMVVNEAFQVAAMIEKLPHSWRDFKNYLKHKCKEMKLEDLVIHVKIEEDNKTAEKKSRGNSTIMGANIVEETAPKSKKRKRSSGQTKEQNKKKFKGSCYNCGKVGHKSHDCRLTKKVNKKGQANIVEKNDDIDDLCAMLSECNLVGNPKEWWTDFGDTRHVCAFKEAFVTYSTAGPEEEISMENNATAKIEDYGKIFLKMTSGKVLTLNNVLHIPTIRKNLVSTSLLVKNGFKCVFVSDKVVVSKNEIYVGKGYLMKGLFKLNVMVVDIMSSSDSAFWKEAVNSEIQSILDNHTWELVNLPPGNKPLGSKWIFKRKIKTDGTIDKYKTRLVVKGYRKKEGRDYFDTYSPVTRITSIRVLVVLTVVYGLEIHQMDVKTAFLNGELEEEIYMEQPEGFVVPGKEKKVCKLVKSLYGLKQVPKQWHAKFDQTMLANGFKINECDKCVYIKNTPGYEVIVCLYVNDILIMSKSMTDINATKRMLASKFDMKDLGVADVILRIRIHKTPQGLALSRSHYIEKVLDKFKYLDFKIAKTPIDVSYALQKNEGESDSQLDYARVLRSLMYIMNCTRPDIACAISKLSRFTSNPNQIHWMAMKRVLGYLKHTQNYALHYNKYPSVIEGYSDANWITESSKVKSTSGYVFIIGGGVVSWKSSKQTCIARSTMEAEFIALDKAGEEAEWL